MGKVWKRDYNGEFLEQSTSDMDSQIQRAPRRRHQEKEYEHDEGVHRETKKAKYLAVLVPAPAENFPVF